MPPPGGKLTVELRIAHRRSYLFRGVGRVVPTCAVLQADRASRAGLRYTNAASALRAAQKNEGWHQASSRLTNRTKEMIHDSVTQPSITRNIPSASVACTRYHG